MCKKSTEERVKGCHFKRSAWQIFWDAITRNGKHTKRNELLVIDQVKIVKTQIDDLNNKSKLSQDA